MQGYLKQYSMKPDKNPVFLYDGREEQNAHAAAVYFSVVLGLTLEE